jgi:hypothetical protein
MYKTMQIKENVNSNVCVNKQRNDREIQKLTQRDSHIIANTRIWLQIWTFPWPIIALKNQGLFEGDSIIEAGITGELIKVLMDYGVLLNGKN